MRSLTWRLCCCCGRHCCGHCGCRLCDADAVHKFRCFHLVNKNDRILEVRSTLATISIAILLALSPMVTLAIGIPVANAVAIYIPIAVFIPAAASTVIIVISAVSACIVSAVQRHRIGRIEIIVFHRCWL